MKKLFLLILVPLFVLQSAFTPNTEPVTSLSKEEGTYFVLAPRGLVLRAKAEVKSEKLLTMPYGAKIKITQAAMKKDMLVDNFPGGMAQVEYNGKKGYAFDGYISRLPAPKENGDDLRKYTDQARDEGAGVLYESCERDYDGYFQSEESIVPYKVDWAEAYLVAQRLFDLKVPFPKASNKKEETFENPDKKEFVWEDALTIRRDEKGAITELAYFYRMEGGGRTITIVQDQYQNGLRISKTLIAD